MAIFTVLFLYMFSMNKSMTTAIVATGGLAPLFQQSADLFDVMEDDLTMHGLTVIHKFNKDNA